MTGQKGITLPVAIFMMTILSLFAAMILPQIGEILGQRIEQELAVNKTYSAIEAGFNRAKDDIIASGFTIGTDDEDVYIPANCPSVNNEIFINNKKINEPDVWYSTAYSLSYAGDGTAFNNELFVTITGTVPITTTYSIPIQEQRVISASIGLKDDFAPFDNIIDALDLLSWKEMPSP